MNIFLILKHKSHKSNEILRLLFNLHREDFERDKNQDRRLQAAFFLPCYLGENAFQEDENFFRKNFLLLFYIFQIRFFLSFARKTSLKKEEKISFPNFLDTMTTAFLPIFLMS